ncbi:hypothetical protein B0T18DRAFT_462023 [Schizothecium vesticola]|uniref:Uncharacterized protein n=1 Tax=Schizothecium vesticola TaxID=314040 RepID=A0AA40F2K1_9PEZI|nr:hypothetical protein B0T18DRAFT_462023 [Schizothecium vesticola]
MTLPRQIPRHVDSGYATQTNTAFTSPVGTKEKSSTSAQSTNNAPQDEFAHSSPRSVPMPGRKDLQIVRRDIDYAFNARFREIAPRMQQLLQKSLQKWSSSVFALAKSRPKRQQQATMSLRLMAVGKTAESAKPTIVIFLAGEHIKSLEAALGQTELRQLYRSDDGVTPSFEVIVVGQEPMKRSYQDVSVLWEASRTMERNISTLCGVQIRLDAGDARVAGATMGGIVKLTYGPGDFKLAGMTAGHPLESLLDTEDTDDEVTLPKHDWALIEIDPLVRIRPNLMPIAGNSGSLSLSIPKYPGTLGRLRRQNGHGTSMTTAPPASFPDVNPIEVALLSGSSHFSGAMLGLLSHMPGSIMLSPDDGFIDAYLLTLDEGQEFQDGDSGSWVVNPTSLEVYGHVVATDITGDAYIVPLYASLEEMKEALGVESVSLPDTADLLDAAFVGEGEGGGGEAGWLGGGGGGDGHSGGGWGVGVGGHVGTYLLAWGGIGLVLCAVDRWWVDLEGGWLRVGD